MLALLTAQEPDHQAIGQGIAYLKQFQPVKHGPRFSHYFYGQYYAAQVMRLTGGDAWRKWYSAIRDELLARQTRPGYWPDSISNDYGTAMALIILQMPRRVTPE